MKFRPLWLALPACAVIAASCKKEEPAAAKDQPAAEKAAPAAGKGAEAAPAAKPAVPALSADERAAKFGIIKHLPKNTESLLSVYDGIKMADRLKKTKLWTVIKEESDGALDNLDKPADGEAKDAPSGPGALLGHEVFLATGKGTSDQLGHLVTVSHRMNYFQGKMFAKMLVAAAKGEEKGMEESSKLSEQTFLDLAKDPQSGMALFDKVQLPPVYIGFKTAQADREQVAQMVASVVEYMGMAEDMVEPVEFTSAGATFKGYKLLGEKFSKQLAKARADMEKDLDPETVDKMLAAIAKKNIVGASAVVGDYVIAFIGGSTEDCQLVAEAKDGLAASNDISYVDGYAGKELAALTYNTKSLSEVAGQLNTGLSDLTNGLRDGLAGAEGLGDTRDIEAMLQIVGEREQALQKLTTTDTSGVVAFFEQGLKIETFGGIDKGVIDWKTPTRLGGLGSSNEVLFFANFGTDTTYDTKAREYAESLVETSYAVAKKFSDAPIKTENPEFKKFQEGMKLFDTKFRTDTVSLVDALRGDLSDALGNESAIVVDLKGGVPTVPGIPQEVADKGKFVRASWISPVADRSKIESSWNKINGSATNILKTISEINGKEIPMQKPVSSEKAGFTTWFFSMPFFNEEFMPSVTVSDKWFIASTSKVHAIELGQAADKESTPGTGFTMTFRFDPLRKFSLDWVKLVDENSAKLFAENEDELKQFTENKPKIEKAIKALEDYDSVSSWVRREDGRLRGTVHFKTH